MTLSLSKGKDLMPHRAVTIAIRTITAIAVLIVILQLAAKLTRAWWN
jgi:hypothetical protein